MGDRDALDREAVDAQPEAEAGPEGKDAVDALKAKLSQDKAAAWELFNALLERGQVNDHQLCAMLAHGDLTSQQQRECMARVPSAGVEPGAFSYTAPLGKLQGAGRSDEVEAAHLEHGLELGGVGGVRPHMGLEADQRALVPEGTFSQSAVQKSEACADQAFGWRFVGGKRAWKAHDLPKPPSVKSQPTICAAAAKRFGRQNQTSAALRCYAASLRAARDPSLIGDVGVFAATDPQLLTATRDAFAAFGVAPKPIFSWGMLGGPLVYLLGEGVVFGLATLAALPPASTTVPRPTVPSTRPWSAKRR